MSSSIFCSITSEYRWVDQFNEHFIIYIDNHPSIFCVTKRVCDTKPEAYAPQQVGRGAYHHLRPDLYEMESRKPEAVKKYLEPDQYKNFKSLIVDKVKVLEPSIRSSYKYLNIDGDILAWIMSIDGVYLFHLLSRYSGKESVGIEDRTLAQDIVMLENQVPAIVLREILKAMQLLDDDDDEKGGDNEDKNEGDDENDEEEDDDDEDEVKERKNEELFSDFLSFCKAHTPLCLTDKTEVIHDTSNLLSYLYNLIVKNWSTRYRNDGDVTDRQLDELVEKVTLAKAVADLTGQKSVSLLSRLPLQKIAALFKDDQRSSGN